MTTTNTNVITDIGLADAGFQAVATECYETARAHGWWDDESGDPMTPEVSLKEIPSKIALMHSELSEALDEYRHNTPVMYEKDGKPEGMVVEFADAVIRIMDTCERLWPGMLVKAMRTKMDFNDSRPYRHGGLKA